MPEFEYDAEYNVSRCMVDGVSYMFSWDYGAGRVWYNTPDMGWFRVL